MAKKRPYLLAISVLMMIVCVGGIIVVARMPALASSIPSSAPPAGVTELTKRVASDERYIASLESVIQVGLASIRGIFAFFLAMFAIITVILLLPGGRPRDPATPETQQDDAASG
jgi:hypothetical protein